MASSELPQATSLDAYAVNKTLILGVRSEYVTDLPSTIQVRIRQLHTRTLSCTMTVDILDGNQPLSSENPVFLKLFDRRFSEHLRQTWRIDPWTGAMEGAYLESVNSGAIDTFLHDLHHIEDYEDKNWGDWDDAQNEAYLFDMMSRLYSSEVAVYNALHEHQGRLIPRLFAGVDVDIMPPGANPQLHNKVTEPFKVKGILIEFVEGHDMWQLPLQFPRSSWQDLVDQAVAIVEVLGDHDILNDDVRPENFLLFESKEGDSKEYRVSMIDFELCRIRGRDESDLKWGRAKCTLGEDRAVTARMNTLLRKHDFALKYEFSTRWDEWPDADTTVPDYFVTTVLREGVVSRIHPKYVGNGERVGEKPESSQLP